MKYAARELALDFNGTPVGQLTQFPPFGSSRDLIDASAYGEDDKDYVLGQRDGDEVAAVIAYDPEDSGHQSIIDSYDNTPGTVVNFTATHTTTGRNWNIPCLITAVSRGGQLGELFALNVTLKIVSPGVTENS